MVKFLKVNGFKEEHLKTIVLSVMMPVQFWEKGMV